MANIPGVVVEALAHRSPLGFAPWDRGRPRPSVPMPRPWHVQPYRVGTWVMRQSKAVDYEAPFTFLLAGRDRALLMDTGAVPDSERRSLRTEVDRLIGDLPLVVAHTHGHGDHVAGDGQFADRARTVTVETSIQAVQHFFGARKWPSDIMSFDLGDREVIITTAPGHHRAAIVIIDPQTRWMLTGDNIYPGRLYVEDFSAFEQSVGRLVQLADVHDVAWALGCHIEMTAAPGHDHALGCTYHPSEPDLELPVDALGRLAAALPSSRKPGVHRFDEFIIVTGSGTRSMGGVRLRSVAHQARERVLGHSPPATG